MWECTLIGVFLPLATRPRFGGAFLSRPQAGTQSLFLLHKAQPYALVQKKDAMTRRHTPQLGVSDCAVLTS